MGVRAYLDEGGWKNLKQCVQSVTFERVRSVTFGNNYYYYYVYNILQQLKMIDTIDKFREIWLTSVRLTSKNLAA